MNITNVRHKFLIHNLCNHEIMFKQLDFRDSFDRSVDSQDIMPVFFSPSDKNA